MAKNTDFNFESFAVQAIKAIDEIRSYGKDSSTPIEHRINAFYRALGLPAAIIQDTRQQKLNNGNTFSPDSLVYENYSTDFNIRKFSFKRNILQEEIDQFISFNQSKMSDGIQELSSPNARIRGSLFPMIVDGEIPIFPQNKRVASAFKTDAELIVGTIRYKRPLIEAIVLMRLKNEGAQNTATQNKVTQDFGTENTQGLGEFSKLILTSLTNSLDNLDDLLDKIIHKANKAIKQTKINFAPVIANIAQQSLARVEPEDHSIGEADKKIFLQNERLKTQQAILTSLEFDDTFSGDLKESRNVKDALLVSNLMSLINTGLSPQSKINKDKKETEIKREKHVSEIKEIFRTLDLLLGTFGGISGVDVLIIIYALFKINKDALLGLLNEESIVNLEKIKGAGIANNKFPVLGAVNELQSVVVDIFNEVESNTSQTKHLNKKSLQEEGSS